MLFRSAHAKKLLSISNVGSVDLWDLETGLKTGKIDNALDAEFMPDGKLILATNVSGKLELRDATTGLKNATIDCKSQIWFRPKLSIGGRYLVASCEDIGTILWDLSKKSMLKNLDQEISNLGKVANVSFSNDGVWLMLANYEGGIFRWNLERNFFDKPVRERAPDYHSILFSNDSKFFGSVVGEPSVLKIFEMWSAEEYRILKAADSPIYAFSFSSDSKSVISVSENDSMQVWDLESGKKLASFFGHTGSIETFQFAKNGKYVLSSSADGTARIWSVDEIIEQGNIVEQACKRLGRNTDLSDIEKKYGFKGLVPICGANPPLQPGIIPLE